MAEIARKRVVSFSIYEIPTKDGAFDHEIEADVSFSGLDIRYNTTFDKVREFFTQKREKGKKASLKVV